MATKRVENALLRAFKALVQGAQMVPNVQSPRVTEVRKVLPWETLLPSLLGLFAPLFLIDSSIISTAGAGGISLCRLDVDLLRHLFGTVVGQAQTHDGQHHGDLVYSPVLWLRLHLTSNLPLQTWNGTEVGTTHLEIQGWRCSFSSTVVTLVTKPQAGAVIKNLGFFFFLAIRGTLCTWGAHKGETCAIQAHVWKFRALVWRGVTTYI